MTIPADILELWQEHSSATFPKGYGEKVINGIDLPLLDAEIAGCIHMYVHGGEKLEFQRVKMLRERLIDLNKIVLLLNSEELLYFNRLRELANLVLQEVER
ncbi:MAG TPA: hypothetical protein VN653_18340 [Anaerolineales bacterium]|nr:hypothetical protein [Anaerolineales bacterium]